MIRREDAVILVIDMQEKLLPKIRGKKKLLEGIDTIIRFGIELSIPVIATEQYSKGLGGTIPEIADILPESPIDKMTFSCMGCDIFQETLKSMKRRQLIVTGIETHVCVMQTCLSAIDEGYEVYLVADAVSAHGKQHHNVAMERMVKAGVTLVTAEMLMFETLQIAGTPDFKKILPLIK